MVIVKNYLSRSISPNGQDFFIQILIFKRGFGTLTVHLGDDQPYRITIKVD